MATRTMVLWCPDWPVRAVTWLEGLPLRAPVALMRAGRVLACSSSARVEGVRRDQRLRDAQSRCPDLVVRDYDPTLDARAFEPVLEAVEDLAPGVQSLRPGTCAVRAQGVSRFHGGEVNAAAVLAERLVSLGVEDCRFGVADGPFAAEQAARRALPQDSLVVPVGGSAEFLADLPVAVLDHPDLVSLLHRLGLRTLGALAGLPARDVLTRFGDDGAWAHRLAGGRDERAVSARKPPPDLVRRVVLEPPLDRAEQVAFSVRQTAEQLVGALADRNLVCTAVRIEVVTDDGRETERTWLHPRWFDTADLVDRVRWQLQVRAGYDGVDGAVSSPVSEVRLVPDEVDTLAHHADGLWGGPPDARVTRALSKVQGMVGHEGVASVVLTGGRSPAERQTLVPWGDDTRSAVVPERSAEMPWPGSLPPPAPATVLTERRPAVVLTAAGHPVTVTGRGALSGDPARFCARGGRDLQPVQAWAGPWPVDERWWDPDHARRYARLQVVGVDGSAWLLIVEEGQWFLEAVYD
ncbi:MAG: DNA polymerase Y family protein [Nocardioidaceae bacterium]|nr:DNA polymerase Y family protein [Nocardioidaceae bacterium]